MGGEDFSFMLEARPGAFIFIGNGDSAGLHHPAYDFNDEVIPHGIPDIAFAEPEEAKARFGFTGKAVILTFGLLSPNKGIEYVIDAMPAILRSRPDAVYVVLGATHLRHVVGVVGGGLDAPKSFSRLAKCSFSARMPSGSI